MVTNFDSGGMLEPLSAAIAPLAMPSLAMAWASNPSLPSAVIDCSISCWALSGLQSGVS